MQGREAECVPPPVPVPIRLGYSFDRLKVASAFEPVDTENVITESGPMNVGLTAPLPLPGILEADQNIKLRTADSEVIEPQVQLYALNSLLKHPLISPALSYLTSSGLPPLFFIAGDREVLQDEVIYACTVFPTCVFRLLMVL